MTDEQERMRAAFLKWEAATNEYHAYLRATSRDDGTGAATIDLLIERMIELKRDFEAASKPFIRLGK